ncbi:hypothetical protein H5410_014931 [Solanum commersonii]|uniref:Uncharacterized protein n=1 Tax=Solanum commersonii TaxID=4109 RepID=A0A9J5ZSN0_SOLCO|nr:hypothetical protein H5410_014931 [Solanum commersonii]
MEKELQQIKSQQHDNKHAELSPSDDSKIPELDGDDGKHQKIQSNSLLHAATGTASTSATKKENKIRYANTNMTKLFDKPFIPKTQKDIFIPPHINTYKETLAEILYDEIKPIIQVIKIGLTREMIIPEKIEKQNEIQKIEIPEFYARKRRNKTSRYGRNKTVGIKPTKTRTKPTTRAIKQNFISTELMANYCKTIGHKYLDHQCSKCYGEDNIIPTVNLE